MALFTLVFDYRGGTYVSQASCDTLGDLISMLGRVIDWNTLSKHVSEKEKQQFLEDLVEIPPTPIDGMKNVWCSSARLGNALVIIHVIETRERASELMEMS